METKRCFKNVSNFRDEISEISRTNIVRNISKQLFSCIYLIQNGLSKSLYNAICLLSDLPWKYMLATYPFFFSAMLNLFLHYLKQFLESESTIFLFSLEVRFPQKLTIMSRCASLLLLFLADFVKH